MVSHYTPYKLNHFSAMPKIETMLELIKKGNDNNLYLANFDKKYSSDNNENMKISDIKHRILISGLFISERITFIKLRLNI